MYSCVAAQKFALFVSIALLMLAAPLDLARNISQQTRALFELALNLSRPKTGTATP